MKLAKLFICYLQILFLVIVIPSVAFGFLVLEPIVVAVYLTAYLIYIIIDTMSIHLTGDWR
jgi:hypothetical protein